MMKCLKHKRIDACTKLYFYLYILYTYYLCTSNIYYIFLVKLNWETDFQFAKVNVDFEIFLQD